MLESGPVQGDAQEADAASAAAEGPTQRRLVDMAPGAKVQVAAVGVGEFGAGLATRLAAMGVIPGKRLKVLRRAAFGGPLVVRVGTTTEIAIRCAEASLIAVTPIAD